MSPLDTVRHALSRVLTDPSADNTLISHFFSERYLQVVNGESLDYTGFIAHIALLKRVTLRLELTLLSIAAAESHVHTHHTVRAVKHDGSESEFEVFAHFEVQEGKITACRELTRQLSGAHHDHDLGARQS